MSLRSFYTRLPLTNSVRNAPGLSPPTVPPYFL